MPSVPTHLQSVIGPGLHVHCFESSRCAPHRREFRLLLREVKVSLLPVRPKLQKVITSFVQRAAWNLVLIGLLAVAVWPMSFGPCCFCCSYGTELEGSRLRYPVQATYSKGIDFGLSSVCPTTLTCNLHLHAVMLEFVNN